MSEKGSTDPTAMTTDPEKVDASTAPVDPQNGTAGEMKPYRPKHLAGIVPIALVVYMCALGGGLEGILAASKKHHGFPIPGTLTNLESDLVNHFPKIADAQIVNKFLASFLPPLVFIPLVIFLVTSCQSIKVVQPFINLGKAGSPARDSVLLNYEDQNPVQVLWSSWKRGNLMVTAAGTVVILSLLFQPLAGSLFQIRIISEHMNSRGLVTGTLEYNPDALARPTPFLASAGFESTDMVSTGLLPPFVSRPLENPDTHRWIVPPFQLLGNDTVSEGDTYLSIRSQALDIEGTCAPAQDVKFSDNKGVITITGSLSQTCSSSLSVTADGDIWFGSAQSADPSCVSAINSTWSPLPSGTNSSFWPVVFAFSQGGTAGTMVYCVARQAVYNVTAWSYVQALSLADVTNPKPLDDNPLTGYVINGIDLKGLPFEETGGDLNTEDTIIGYLLADSVIRDAGIVYDGVGVNTTAQNIGLSDPAQSQWYCLNVYLNYLATLSLRIYVDSPGDAGFPVPAILYKDVNRIYAYAPAIHTLSALLFFSAILLGTASYFNHQQRGEYLHVRNAPGSIAAAAAMLSQVDAFDDVKPTDSIADIKKKLGGRVFRINSDGTWNVEDGPSRPSSSA